MKKRIAAVALCLVLLFSGCADVESFLQPPRSQGQQQAVHDALETALKQDGDVNAAYILKYPVGGNISSAFVLLDENGVQTQAENAVTAVAFYAPAVGQRTHIHLLQKDADGWQSVADVIGEANDLHKVTLGDLDGDGVCELLVGWNLYSSDFQLSVYSLRNALVGTADVGRYTEYYVGDLNADGGEDILLLHIGSTVTATLKRWSDRRAQVLGSATLHSGIRSFDKLLFGKLNVGTDGVYVDALLDTGMYTTELLYWDGERLQAPLHRGDGAVGLFNERAAHVPVMDVDGNGVPEIPVSARMPGADDGWQWLTEWYTWDVSTNTAVRRFGSIVNTTDGYCIELEDEWIATLRVQYDDAQGILWLYHPDGNGENVPFLAVSADGTASDGERDFEALPGASLRVWYEEDAPYRLSLEKISYMLVTL